MSEETIRIEEEELHHNGNGQKKRWEEELTVASDQLVGKVQELMREAAVRKITIKDEKGKTLLTFPLYAGVIGVLVFGPYSALALLAAWFAKFSILIEREMEETEAGTEKSPEEVA